MIIGRATTDEQKRAIVERLYAAWVKMPEQRLGQLLRNSLEPGADMSKFSHLFYAEDFELIRDVEEFAGRSGKEPDAPQER